MLSVRDYTEKAHKMPVIIFDSFVHELAQRPNSVQAITMDDFDDYIKDMSKVDDITMEKDPFPNAAVHGPQGKKGIYNGIQFDSMWECAYYKYIHDIKGEWIQRNTTEHLDYYIDGRVKKFYPDFKISTGFVEIKGIYRAADNEKRAQHPEVLFLDAIQMKPIIEQVNKAFPNWKKDYLPR